MEIIKKKVTELVPYENNPRRNEQAVEYVVNSIKEFGFRNPIVIDGDNVIIAGHTRLLAAKELGMTEVPCIIADDLTEEQANALRLVDNKAGEEASWDYTKLQDELRDIKGIDMSYFDFTSELNLSFDEDEEVIEKPKKEKEKFILKHVCPMCSGEF